MTIAVWIVSGLLAAMFLASGAMKLTKSASQLREDPNMGWSTDVSDSLIKVIGAAEVAGAVGLILPVALGILPVLTPLAAVGLAVVMVGAVVAHARRHEIPSIAVNSALFALAVFVAVERFASI